MERKTLPENNSVHGSTKAVPDLRFDRLIKLKGYHPEHNPAKDYQTAKQPIGKNWTVVNRDGEAWESAGGWVGALIPEGLIVCDIDDTGAGAFLLSALKRAGASFYSMATPNGFQFFFKDSGAVPKQRVKEITAGGFLCDYRLHGRGLSVITGRTIGRVNEGRDLTPMPAIFIPLKKYDEAKDSDKLLPLPIGEGQREYTLFQHACRIRSLSALRGIKLDIERTMQEVNQLLCDVPLPPHELNHAVQSAEQYEAPEPTGGSMAKKDKPNMTAHFPSLVDLATDENEDIIFLVKGNGGELIELPVWKDGETTYTPPDKSALPFTLPRAAQVRHWHKESDSPRNLFNDLMNYLKRFAYLPPKQWILVACHVFLSYLQDHRDIFYLAMLLFWAVPERGKSRTGKAYASVAFRCVHVVDMREANLFRYSQNLRATLFFDLMDLWKEADRNGSKDILLLRYERGAKVARVIYPDKGAFKDMMYYDVFGPTVMATNVPIHKILDTRCIPIPMPFRPGNYENCDPEKAIELKERLTAWRAKVIDTPLPAIAPVWGLNGRMWDISRPLLQVCKAVCPDKLDDLEDTLLEISGQRRADSRNSIEGRIMEIINELSPNDMGEWEIPTADILARLNAGRPDDRKMSPQGLGKKLTALGLPTVKRHGTKSRQIDRETFDTLLFQYGLTDPPEIKSPMSPKSPDGLNTPFLAGDSAGDSAQSPPESPPGIIVKNQGAGDSGDNGDNVSGVGAGETAQHLHELTADKSNQTPGSLSEAPTEPTDGKPPEDAEAPVMNLTGGDVEVEN